MCPALLFRLFAFRAATWCLSSRSVTQTQNQLIISTNMKVKKTRFLRLSPPHCAGAYLGFFVWAEGWAKRPRGLLLP